MDVAAAGLTCVGQPIVIGAGMTAASGFRTMLYGDYQITFPQRNAWESADAATWHAERMQRLGVNQFVNRANWAFGLDFANNDEGRGLIRRLGQRLAADPLAVAMERADLGGAAPFDPCRLQRTGHARNADAREHGRRLAPGHRPRSPHAGAIRGEHRTLYQRPPQLPGACTAGPGWPTGGCTNRTLSLRRRTKRLLTKRH